MKLVDRLLPVDERLVASLRDFVPAEVFDIHAHLVRPAPNLGPHLQGQLLGAEEYTKALKRWLPIDRLDALLFGFPSKGNDRSTINRWMAAEIQKNSQGRILKGLVLTAPDDPPEAVQALLKTHGFAGIKPYHLYAPMADTRQAAIEDFAPEWMWELCQGHDGVLMLHIMRDAALGSEANIADIVRLARRYPRCRLVLAHVGRSFSYRSARSGLPALARAGLDNVWVDTSAVTESESIRTAIETLGTNRVMFGTDYPICELRGRVVATGEFFTWIYPEDEGSDGASSNPGRMTLIGIESVICLKEAAEDCGLGSKEIQDIFCQNARKLLAPHIGEPASAPMGLSPAAGTGS